MTEENKVDQLTMLLMKQNNDLHHSLIAMSRAFTVISEVSAEESRMASRTVHDIAEKCSLLSIEQASNSMGIVNSLAETLQANNVNNIDLTNQMSQTAISLLQQMTASSLDIIKTMDQRLKDIEGVQFHEDGFKSETTSAEATTTSVSTPEAAVNVGSVIQSTVEPTSAPTDRSEYSLDLIAQRVREFPIKCSHLRFKKIGSALAEQSGRGRETSIKLGGWSNDRACDELCLYEYQPTEEKIAMQHRMQGIVLDWANAVMYDVSVRSGLPAITIQSEVIGSPTQPDDERFNVDVVNIARSLGGIANSACGFQTQVEYTGNEVECHQPLYQFKGQIGPEGYLPVVACEHFPEAKKIETRARIHIALRDWVDFVSAQINAI